MEEKNSLEKKRKKLTSSSIGNKKCKFNQQKPKKPKKDSSIELSAREHLRDIGIINDLDSLSHCCPIGGDWGCCLKHFIDKETDPHKTICIKLNIFYYYLKQELIALTFYISVSAL